MIGNAAVDDVTIQFVTEAGLAAFLIRWFTHSDYSHVDFVLADGRLLGARSDRGVQIRPADYATFTHKLRVTIPIGTEKAQNVYAYALEQIGKPYDMKAIFGFMFNQHWEDDDAWFCSNLVAAAFKKGSFPLLNPLASVKRITPGDILLSPYIEATWRNTQEGRPVGNLMRHVESRSALAETPSQEPPKP